MVDRRWMDGHRSPVVLFYLSYKSGWNHVTLFSKLLGNMPQVRARAEDCELQTSPISLCTPQGGLALCHSFVMSQRVWGFPRLQNFSALLCVVLLHQCHLGDIFLFTNYLVVEVGEGCRQRECSWLGARVCYWVFGVGVVYMCECMCVSPFSHRNPWQQVWHVVMGNYAAQRKTFFWMGVTHCQCCQVWKRAWTHPFFPFCWGLIYWCIFFLFS